MKTLALIAAGAAAASFTAYAARSAGQPEPAGAYGSPASASAPACFRVRQLHNHTVADPHTMYLNYDNRAVYRVTMSDNCLAAATSSDPIIIKERTGSDQICKPIDLDVSVAVGGIPNRCIVSSIDRLSPEEAAALPRRLRP
jgi:hypothetical protein